MSTEDKKLVVQRFWNEVVNQGRLEVIDEIFDPDCVFHDPLIGKHSGLGKFRYLVEMMRTAFPDIRVDIEDQMAGERNRVITHWTGTGTHTGSVEGVEPTGERVRMPGASISRVVDGLIREVWLTVEPLDRSDDANLMSMFCRYFPRLC